MNKEFEKILQKLKELKKRYADLKMHTKNHDEIISYAGKEQAINLAIEYVKDAEKSHKNRGWIPYSERTPGDGEYILVSFENFHLPSIGRYEENEEGGNFYRMNDNQRYSSYGLFVNAWMPLPEPYREE